jgi:hypothetical protein
MKMNEDLRIKELEDKIKELESSNSDIYSWWIESRELATKLDLKLIDKNLEIEVYRKMMLILLKIKD